MTPDQINAKIAHRAKEATVAQLALAREIILERFPGNDRPELLAAVVGAVVANWHAAKG